MRAAALLALAVPLILPSAAALGILPPEPRSAQAPGLSEVTFRVPVRTGAEVVGVEAAGDPVGAAALAPVDGPPRGWTPLAAEPRLDVPPDRDRCWRGYCDVHEVVVRLLAPNADGETRVPVALAAGGARVLVPLHLETTRRAPHANVTAEAVRVEVPHARTLQGVHLASPNGSWAAGGPDGTFRVPRDRLPAGEPLTPTLTLRNGTAVRGPPVTLPADPAPGEAGADAQGNASGGTGSGGSPGSDPSSGSSSAGNASGDPRPPPTAPPRASDGGRDVPTLGGPVLAALAVAARATL